MSIPPISNSLFFVQPLHKEAYQLDIQFLDEQAHIVSRKNVIFKKELSVKTGEVIDVYSQNGVQCDPTEQLFTSELSGLFTVRDEEGLKNAAKKMGPLKPQGPTVMVLDIKDKERKYLDKSSIQKSEAAFCEFLSHKNSSPSSSQIAKTVHQIYQNALPCHYVLCEGALKCDILKQFSEQEASWFLEQKLGGIRFCQFAEFYMNAFKLGQATPGIHLKDYFQPISNSFESFQPQSKSTVWYPKAYKKIYSIDGDFVKTLKPVFSISGSFDATTKITSISTEMLP